MTYRQEVERLLEQIRDRARELRLLRTYGVTATGLAERKRELAGLRDQLAALVSG